MLRDCADGFTFLETPHNYCVRYKEHTYPTLPRGAKGDHDPEIYAGKIRQMVRQFGIEECAKKHFSM